MAYELNIIRGWIDDTLRGDPALSLLITGVYQSIAPEGTALPYVIWDVQAGSDLQAGCERHMAQVVILAKVVYDNNGEPANPWAAIARLDELLKGAQSTGESHRITARSGGTVSYLEDGESKHFRHDGRLWQFSVSPQFE